MEVENRKTTNKHLSYGALLLFSIFITSTTAAVEPLSLHRALDIEGVDGFQPSGLAVCNKRLLVVSDQHDNVIYELLIDDKRALAQPFLELKNIPRTDLPAEFAWWKKIAYRAFLLVGRSVYDWEGISCSSDGTIYLASESTAGILEVSADGSNRWLSTDLFAAARREGMMVKDNAYVEGVSHDGVSLVVAMEREPRGIAVLKQTDPTYTVDSIFKYQTPQNLLPAIGARPDDISDVVALNGTLLTLERNRSGVCRLNRQSMVADVCWSYAHVESDPAYGYQDTTYGLGEGLTVFNGLLYVALDNNGQGRARDAKNTAPQLFEFKLPK